MADGKVIIATDLDSSGAVKGAKKLGSQLKSGIGSAAGVAVKGIAAIGTASVAAGASMVKFAKDTADTGDHIDKMSQKLGISAEAYQKWDYVAQISGTSIDGLKMGFKTLGNTLDEANKGNEKAIAKFEQLGLSMDEIQGKSKEEVFEKTIKSLQNVTDETERAALANEMFGRSSMELGPLLNSSNEDIDELMKKAEDYGMVMSDEAVKASAEFTDSLTTMNQTLQGLKNRMSAEFLPSLTEITDGMALLFKGDTEEGLAKIDKGIEDFVSKLSEIMPKVLEIGGSLIESLATAVLKNLPKLIQTGLDIGIQLLNGILSALPQIIKMLPDIIRIIATALIDNAPLIIDSLIEIAKLGLQFLFEELPTLITELADFIAGLDLNEIATGLFDSFGTAIEEGLPNLVDAVLSLVTSIATFIFDNLDVIIDVALEIILALATGLIDSIPKLVEKLPEIITSLVNGLLESLPKIIDAGVKLLTALVEDLPTIIDSLVEAAPKIIEGIIDALIDNMPAIIDAGVKLLEALITDLPKIIITLQKAGPKIVIAIVKKIKEKFPDMIQAGKDLLGKLWDKLPEILTTAKNSVTDIWDTIKEAFDGLWTKMKDIGKNLIDGLWEGIKDAKDGLLDSLSGFADDVVDGIAGFFGIASPSKVMRDQIGRYLAEGIYVGFAEYNPMDKIKQDLAYGMSGLDYAIRQDAVVDYSAMAQANAQAMEGTKIVLNDRELGRAVRGYV